MCRKAHVVYLGIQEQGEQEGTDRQEALLGFSWEGTGKAWEVR